MDYSQSINVLKLNNACIVSIKGKTSVKKGVFIPIQDNDLYVSLDENLKPKGVFLNINAWELKEKGQYGDTHLIKQAFSKDYRDAHENVVNNAQILGNMKPIERERRNEVDINAISVDVENDDLPF